MFLTSLEPSSLCSHVIVLSTALAHLSCFTPFPSLSLYFLAFYLSSSILPFALFHHSFFAFLPSLLFSYFIAAFFPLFPPNFPVNLSFLSAPPSIPSHLIFLLPTSHLYVLFTIAATYLYTKSFLFPPYCSCSPHHPTSPLILIPIFPDFLASPPPLSHVCVLSSWKSKSVCGAPPLNLTHFSALPPSFPRFLSLSPSRLTCYWLLLFWCSSVLWSICVFWRNLRELIVGNFNWDEATPQNRYSLCMCVSCCLASVFTVYMNQPGVSKAENREIGNKRSREYLLFGQLRTYYITILF